MWRPFHTNQTKEQIPVTSTDLSADLRRMEEEVADQALEAGMAKVETDDHQSMIDYKLRFLSEKLYGTAGPEPALLLEQENELRREREEIAGETRAGRPQFAARFLRQDSSTAAPPAVDWRRAVVSVAATFALTGLGLEVVAGALGWRGWGSLALLALLAATNLTTILFFVRRLSSWPLWADAIVDWRREYLDYRRVRTRLDELDQRILQARQRRVTEVERRKLVEEWVAQARELMWSQYSYHKARGARASQIVSGS